MIPGWRGLGVLLAIALVGVGAHYAHKRLAALPRYQVDLGMVAVQSRGTYPERELIGALSDHGFAFGEEGQEPGRRSVFDTSLLADVVGVVQREPWVRRVVRAERAYPARLKLIVELRAPRLAVGLAENFYLVDADGVRLPGVHQAIPDVGRPLLLVTGISATEPPAPGAPWRADGLADGMAMVGVIESAGLAERVQVHEIDVGIEERYGRRVVELVLGPERTRVLWGKSPLERDPIDAPDATKLAHLESLLEAWPGLVGLEQISIAGQTPAFLELGRAEASARAPSRRH